MGNKQTKYLTVLSNQNENKNKIAPTGCFLIDI